MIIVKNRRGVIYYASFLLILVIICFSFYPTRVLPLMNRGVTPYFLGIILSIICVPYFYKSRDALFVILYCLVVFLNYYWGNKAFPTLGSALTESVNILLPVAVFYLVKNQNDNVFNIVLLYSILLVIGVTTYQSYQIEQITPGILRSVSHLDNEEEIAYFYLMGLSPYQLPHALPALIPPCIMVIKKPEKGIQRAVGALFLAIIILLVMLSQSLGAFIMMLFALIVSILVKEQNVRRNLRILIVSGFLMLILAGDTVQLSILDFLRSFFETDSKMYQKLTELSASVLSDDITYVTGNRGNLFDQTITAIIRNPIFGVNDKSYGNHNALIDRWACLGLVGFIPLLLFIFHIIKVTLKGLPERLHSYYLIGVITSLVMMCTKNMMGWFQWLCFVLLLPLMFFVWRRKQLTTSN